jgi:hypothetical protein
VTSVVVVLAITGWHQAKNFGSWYSVYPSHASRSAYAPLHPPPPSLWICCVFVLATATVRGCPRIAIGVREDPREVNGASGYAVVIALTANVCAICATSFSGYSPVSPVFRCLTFEDRESGPYRAMSSGSAKRPKL